jgi:hypothetical protein
MDFSFVLAHIWSACSIEAVRPCCLRSLVCSSHSQFPSEKIKLGMEIEYYIGQRAEAHSMCKKGKKLFKARTLYCESHPGHPENRDPDEIRLSAGRRGKAKKSPGAKTLRSFFRRISIFTIAGQLHQSLLVDEAGPSPVVAHCRPGDLVLEGYSFAL